MKKSIYISILCAVCAASVQTQAQDLSTEITVERDVDTQLPPAQPLQSVFPKVPELPVANVGLYPTQYTRATEFDAAVDSVAALWYTAQPEPDMRPGYIRAGYFPVYNAEVEAGYRLVRKGQSYWDAAVRYHGESYNNKSAIDYDRLVDNTFGVATKGVLWLNRNKIIMRATGHYFHTATRYGMPDGNEQHQGMNCAGVRMSFEQPVRKGVAWHVGAGYHYFGTTTEIGAPAYLLHLPSDNRLTADAGIAYDIASKHICALALDADLDLLSTGGDVWVERPTYGGSGMYMQPTLPSHATQGIVGIIPAVKLTIKGVDIKAGVRLDFGFGTDDAKFFVAPDVDLSWSPADAFGVYAHLKGGQHFYTQADQYALSVFLPGTVASTRYKTPIDGRAGIVARPFAGFAVDLYGGYSAVYDLPMLTLYQGAAQLTTLMPTDLTGWYGGAKVKYDWRKVLSLRGDVAFYAHGGYNHGYIAAQDHAGIVASAAADVKPIERLTIGAGWQLRAGRRYYTGANPWAEAVNMRNISDLNLYADYELRSGFKVFLHLNNLLNRHALVLPHMAQQGINGLAGIEWRF